MKKERHNPNYRDWLKHALNAATFGADIANAYFGKVSRYAINEKKAGDYVSVADKSSENAIIQYFFEKTPDFEILTEERGVVNCQENPHYRWIIDPLDGTTNFLRNFPMWSVSIALEKRNKESNDWGEIVLGVVNAPVLNSQFYAVIGEGAYLNHAPLITNNNVKREFKDALIATGFPFRNYELIKSYTELFSEVLGKCADIRRPGAVTIDLCYTAMGIFDGFFELDLAPWDLAAAGLIVREAGGFTSNFQGGKDYLTTGDIIAGRNPTYKELLKFSSLKFPKARLENKYPS